MKIVTSGIHGYSVLHFEWYLVNWCNYKCSYCNAIEKNVEHFSKQTSPSKYKLVLQRLRMLKMPFEVDLYGGEPTLHPHFLEILEELGNMPNCKLVEIKTNLSRPLHFLKQSFKNPKIKLAASYHAEYFTEDFITKCIALKDFNFYCHVNLSDNPNDWQQIIAMLEQFDSENVKYDLNVLLSTKDYTIKYDQKFFNLFKDKISNISDKQKYFFKFENGHTTEMTAFEIYKNNMASFTGFKCQALLYDIDSDGTITNCCNGKPLPLLVKDNIFTDMNICEKTHCHADMMLNFYKENTDV